MMLRTIKNLGENNRLLFQFWSKHVVAGNGKRRCSQGGKLLAFGFWKMRLGEDAVEHLLIRLKFDAFDAPLEGAHQKLHGNLRRNKISIGNM